MSTNFHKLSRIGTKRDGERARWKWRYGERRYTEAIEGFYVHEFSQIGTNYHEKGKLLHKRIEK